MLLNRFVLRPLYPEELTPWHLAVELDPPPKREEVIPLLSLLTRRVGGKAARLGDHLVTWSPPESLALQGNLRRGEQVYTYRLHPRGQTPLNPKNPTEREALSTLARRLLDEVLEGVRAKGFRVEGRAVYRREYAQGRGWRVLKGAVLDLWVSPAGEMILEVDLAFRILCEMTLEAWLAQGHAPPKRVRNTYDDRTWELIRVGEEAPESVRLPAGLSLLEYHTAKGRLPERSKARVAWVRDPKNPREEIPHLTTLLQPVLTLEDLQEEEGATLNLSIPWQQRYGETRKVADWVAKEFGVKKPQPLRVQAHRLESPLLRARTRVGKPADALHVGLYQAKESTLALLSLDATPGWPGFLRKALERAFKASQASIKLREIHAHPSEGLAFREALREAREAGVQAVLVLTSPMSWEARNQLKALLLKEGLPSQFLNLPLRETDRHRWENALLGLLAKAGQQVVALEGSYPAELALGFDAGGKESFRFGGAACAVGQEGSLLLWSLPEAQAGERIPGEVVWDLTEEALLAFKRRQGRLPSRILLLRDGRVPKDEFTLALTRLSQEGVAFDLVSVRKSGGGRIYPTRGRLADGLFVPLEDKTFLLLTVHREFRGTPRPLKMVHEEGNTPLETLARQIYHLTRLYPASGFLFPRLPAPLHLADRLVKEVGRLGVRHLKDVDREKLFFV